MMTPALGFNCRDGERAVRHVLNGRVWPLRGGKQGGGGRAPMFEKYHMSTIPQVVGLNHDGHRILSMP